MSKVVKNSSSSTSKIRPALTPEAREAQLIALAENLAEQQLSDGTASSQLIVHYVKRGSREHKLEIERLERENELLHAKVAALESSSNSEKLYSKVLKAMKIYGGYDGDEDDDIEEDIEEEYY